MDLQVWPVGTRETSIERENVADLVVRIDPEVEAIYNLVFGQDLAEEPNPVAVHDFLNISFTVTATA